MVGICVRDFACVADRIGINDIEALEPWTNAGWSVHVVSSPWLLACLRPHAHRRALLASDEAADAALGTVVPCTRVGCQVPAATLPTPGLRVGAALLPLLPVLAETKCAQKRHPHRMSRSHEDLPCYQQIVLEALGWEWPLAWARSWAWASEVASTSLPPPKTLAESVDAPCRPTWSPRRDRSTLNEDEGATKNPDVSAESSPTQTAKCTKGTTAKTTERRVLSTEGRETR